MNIILGFAGGNSSLGGKVKDSLEKEGLEVNDIKTLFSKKAIEEYVTTHTSEVDVVILNEFLEPDNPYREKEIERLTSLNESLNVLLIVSKSHHGDDFMLNLFNIGFYNAIYDKDSSMSKLATYIRTPRRRRVTMAYYGISNSALQEPKRPEAMTIGMALDMVRGCSSDEEVVKTLVMVLDELGDISFSQFVKHLPYEIYELGATISELAEYFPTQTEKSISAEVPIQYKEVKNDVIAVIDEGNSNGRASFLSFAIARGLAETTTLQPSYVKLPLSQIEPFEILPFTDDFKAQFISHLQAISNGMPCPTAKNMCGGVSVVCKNPVTDMLDDWDILASYKCLFNASHPVVLDVGSDFENEQLCAILKEVSVWVVVVPEDVPVGAYLMDLQKRIGVLVDIPIIALSRTAKETIHTEKYAEISFSQYFDDNSKVEYHAYDKIINQIIMNTTFGEGMNVGGKKKSFVAKPQKFSPAILNGTKEIALLGSGHGSGCTYSAIAMASLLAKYHKVAVVECNESHDFECLAANTKCKKYKVENVITFAYKGADFYYDCTYDYFHKHLKSDYNFVIYDCGVDNMAVFQSADCKVAVVSGAIWRMDEVDLLARQLDMFDKKREVSCLVSGKHTKELSNYRLLCHKRSFYGVPYMEEPSLQHRDFVAIVSKIVGVPLR